VTKVVDNDEVKIETWNSSSEPKKKSKPSGNGNRFGNWDE